MSLKYVTFTSTSLSVRVYERGIHEIVINAGVGVGLLGKKKMPLVAYDGSGLCNSRWGLLRPI